MVKLDSLSSVMCSHCATEVFLRHKSESLLQMCEWCEHTQGASGGPVGWTVCSVSLTFSLPVSAALGWN